MPSYASAPAQGERAFVKFDFSSPFPITVGQVLAAQDSGALQKLFVRARGNPVIADVNPDGVWVAAGKTMGLSASATTSASRRCSASGQFTPRANVNYEIRLKQDADACTLSVYEIGATEVLSNDFQAASR